MGDTECVGDQRNWAAAADNVVLMLGDSPAGGEGHFSSISDEKKKASSSYSLAALSVSK